MLLFRHTYKSNNTVRNLIYKVNEFLKDGKISIEDKLSNLYLIVPNFKMRNY